MQPDEACWKAPPRRAIVPYPSGLAYRCLQLRKCDVFPRVVQFESAVLIRSCT